MGTVHPGLSVNPLGLSAVFSKHFLTSASMSKKVPYLSVFTGSTFPEIAI